jgi:hypothetical protein
VESAGRRDMQMDLLHVSFPTCGQARLDSATLWPDSSSLAEPPRRVAQKFAARASQASDQCLDDTLLGVGGHDMWNRLKARWREHDKRSAARELSREAAEAEARGDAVPTVVSAYMGQPIEPSTGLTHPEQGDEAPGD